jgi:hypothetical protein
MVPKEEKEKRRGRVNSGGEKGASAQVQIVKPGQDGKSGRCTATAAGSPKPIR